jgi:hypothetical protein
MLSDLKQCIADAQEVIADISSPELKIEAFRVVLSTLIDMKVKKANPSPATRSSTQDTPAIVPIVENEDELPVISPANGTGNNIRLLFAAEWGNRRRTVTEINQALDANGVPDPKHVSTALSRLIESKELLRIKQNGNFVYWRNPAPTS